MIDRLSSNIIDRGTHTKHVGFIYENCYNLFLTLSVSTSIIEHAFSYMKIIETRLHKKIKDDFLTDYIEIKIVEKFTIDMIIYYFQSMNTK